MTILTISILLLTGIIAGIMTGFTGASGVMIVVPLLNLLLGFPIHKSIGTSLLADVIASIAVSYTYFKFKNTHLTSALWIALGSVSGALLSARFAVHISPSHLGISYGIFLLISGGTVWKKGFNREEIVKKLGTANIFTTDYTKTAASIILGFFVGISTGIFGAGGGFLIFLILIFVLGFPLHRAIGTSTLIMVITAGSGAFGYSLHGYVNFTAGAMIGLSAIVGGVVSSIFANRVNEKALARIIGFVYFSLGIIMIIIKIIKSLS